MKENSQFIEDSFEFNLGSPVKYKPDGVGQLVDTRTLRIVSPNLDHYIVSRPLAQMVKRAMLQIMPIFAGLDKFRSPEERKLIKAAAEEEDKKDKTPIELGRQMEEMLMTSEIDIPEAHSRFQELALAGCVTVEGKPINIVQWDEIPEREQLEMFFQFVGVFIASSLFAPPSEEGS